jgi:hypothetical protein
MHQKCCNYALNNLLFGLCRSVWIIDWLVTPHLRVPTRLLPPKVLRARERARTLYPSIVFTYRFAIVFAKEFGGACHNLSLGLMTKARVCKGASQEGSPRVWESVREWTLTLLSELPLWESEYRWTPRFWKRNCRGQSPLDWDVPYIIKKLLECKCLKWACMTHLDT